MSYLSPTGKRSNPKLSVAYQHLNTRSADNLTVTSSSSSTQVRPRKSGELLPLLPTQSPRSQRRSMDMISLKGEAVHLSAKDGLNGSIKASLEALNQYRLQKQLKWTEKRQSRPSADSIKFTETTQSTDQFSLSSGGSFIITSGQSEALGISGRTVSTLRPSGATEPLKKLIDDRIILAAATVPPIYPALPHQEAIFNELNPQPHEFLASRTRVDQRFTISQLYSLPYKSDRLDVGLLKRIVSNVLLAHPVLRTKFVRNDAIVDADVFGEIEGVLNQRTLIDLSRTQQSSTPKSSNSDLFDISDGRVRKEILDVVHRLADRGIHVLTKEQAAELTVEDMINTYGQHKILAGHPVTFDIVLFQARTDQDLEESETWQWLFLFPSIVCDEFTAYLISNTVINLYCSGDPNYTPKLGKVDFIYHAVNQNEIQKGQGPLWLKDAVCAYRDQLIELTTARESEDVDKVKFREKIEGYKQIRCNIDRQLVELKQARTDMEKDLQDSINQRRLMDLQSIDDMKSSAVDSGSCGIVRKNYITYIDSVTGETIIILNHAKEALMKTVLGEEVTEDNILPLLRKHNVSEDSITKLKADKMDLEKFVQCNLADFEAININQSERRQLVALIEYVRSRVKECIEDQAKVKFALERKIQKLQRDINNITGNQLKAKQLEWDKNEEQIIHLSAILNPQLVKRLIPVASAPINYEKRRSSVDIDEKVGDIEHITVVDCEETFTDDFMAAVRNERLLPDRHHYSFFPIVLPEKFKEMSEGFSISWRLDSTSSSNTGTRPNINFITCLAAYSVLIRHMTGHSKFVIGYHRRQASDPLGPIGGVVPIKIDMSQKHQNLGDLCTQLNQTITYQWEKSHGIILPLICLKDELARQMNTVSDRDTSGRSNMQVDQITASMVSMSVSSEDIANTALDFSLQYEFWPRDQVIKLKRQGVDIEKWVTGRAPGFQWSVNHEEPFDLKFVVVEAADANDTVVAGIWYDRTRVDFDRIVKWSDRLLSILSNLDYANHKMSVADIVGRFYQRVFTKSSSDLLGSSGSALSVKNSSSSLTLKKFASTSSSRLIP